MSEVLAGGGLAQDRADRDPRAAGAHRVADGGLPARARGRAAGSTRRSRSPPATARSSTSWSATRSRPRAPCWRCSRARPGSGRPSCVDGIYSLRNCDAARHLYRVTERPGVDDRRRGRGPGPGQARLRAGADRPHDRPADRTSCSAPRWPPASACARRRRSPPGTPASPPWRSSSRATRSASLAARHVLIIGAGETARAHGARAARTRASTTMFVANRRRERAIALAQRFGGGSVSSTSCRPSSSAPTSWSPPPPRRTRCSAPRSSRRDARPAAGARCC